MELEGEAISTKHEYDTAAQQIQSLEKRLQAQESEMLTLKSSFELVQSRLKEVEEALVRTNMKKPIATLKCSTTDVRATCSMNIGIKNKLKPPQSVLPITDHLKLTSSLSVDHPDKGQIQISSRPAKGRVSSAMPFTRPRPVLGKGEIIKKASSLEHLNKNSKKFSHTKGKKSSKQTSYNDEEGSVKIYLRGRPIILYKPSCLESYDPYEASQLPERKLQLEWVYGYRGKDCRSNLYFLPNDEIVYFIAAVVVLYDFKNDIQRHYTAHNDDIKCLAIHPSKSKIATGQVSGVEVDGKPRPPQVHIWDIASLETLYILQSFDRPVSSVCFSIADGGSLLCVIDDSNDHVLSVWNWQKGKKITETKSSKDPVHGCEFHPHSNESIITYGKSNITFWTLEKSQLTKKQGLFEKHEKPKFILCVSFTDEGEVLSGDSNGRIQVWSKSTTKKITRVIENLHSGPIFSIYSGQDYFLTGGRDGKINKLSKNLEYIAKTQIPENAGAVRMIGCNDDGMILVGTKSNKILFGNFDGEFETLVNGHMDELWALDIHPKNSHFLTGAYDKQLVLWDAMTHSPIWTKIFDEPVQSASFHPVHENLVAVAMTTGRWHVMDSTNQEFIVSNQDGPEQHDVIKFSPDGSRLAIGSHDNHIYIYDVSDDGRTYTNAGRCSGHSSYVTHFDWSKDGKFIQSNSGDYELLYWDANTCKQITSSQSFRDVEWHTQSCVLGFNVLGIWPEGADGTDINAAERSVDCTLLATGDDFGEVHLYNYPCHQIKGVGRQYRGHSSHVTSVRFLDGNATLLSIGGRDCSAMQWHVV